MFGDKLRELRKNAKMTQQELATRLGLERSSIGKYEKGGIMPSDEVKLEIAALFNVSLDYLLGNEFGASTEHSEAHGNNGSATAPETNTRTLSDADLNAIVQRVQSTGLRGELVELLKSLTPAQEQRVLDFVRGLKSSDTE